ncbi:MAG: DUF4190 domain-containing protein [Leucobacter sp.]
MSTPNQPQQPGATQPTTPLPQNGQPAYTRPGQQYQQPVHQQQYAAPGYAAAPAAPQSTATTVGQTNTYALLAIVLAFLAPIAAIVFGHLGLGQIKRTGDAGRGLALTGLIIGYSYFAFLALFIVVYVGLIFTMIGAIGSAASSFDSY